MKQEPVAQGKYKLAAGNVAHTQKIFTITQHGGITSKCGLTPTPRIAVVVVKLHQKERMYGKFVETRVMTHHHRVAVLIDQYTREKLAVV